MVLISFSDVAKSTLMGGQTSDWLARGLSPKAFSWAENSGELNISPQIQKVSTPRSQLLHYRIVFWFPAEYEPVGHPHVYFGNHQHSIMCSCP